jgi:hypothetical protein
LDISGAECSGLGCCSHIFENNLGLHTLDPRKIDKVVPPDKLFVANQTHHFYTDESCSNTVNPQGPEWRKGTDLFCSQTWPYDVNCQKHIASGCDPSAEYPDPNACRCQSSAAADWPEDPLDDLVQGLRKFTIWAEDLARMRVSDLRKTFAEWYPDAAYWFGEECDNLAV